MANKRFDVFKALIAFVICLFGTVFIYMMEDTKTDMREMRVTNQKSFSELLEANHDLELAVERLKVRIKILAIMPPPEKPVLSTGDIASIVEFLKEND